MLRPSMRSSLLVLATWVAAGCGTPARPIAMPPPVEVGRGAAGEPPAADADAPATPLADAYREVAARILAAAREPAAVEEGYARLAHLTDRIGHRLSGSKALDQAIAWAAQVMGEDGHAVRLQKVMVPHWVRGAESARLVAPVERELAILGLGGTVATPRGGLTAPVVVVTSWEDLEAKQEQVRGKIVLYDVPMPAWSEEHGSGYGQVVAYRWAGPARAAALGAVGVLVRSVTARSLRTPHTGSMNAEATPRIPAAAVSVEDAELIHRLARAGETVRVKLVLSARTLPDAPSANVIGELPGRELPHEVVVIGAHIDSWDVGQGAHDDGAGCVAVMQALTVLRRLGLAPRRTIRVVLYTNEENGLRGARAYAEAHQAELADHVMALEMDGGAFAPRGFTVDAGRRGAEAAADDPRRDAMLARVAEVASLLAPIDATRAVPGHAGADIDPLARAGVPALGLWTDGRSYFDYHHTEADTLDKVDPAALADDVAAIAVMAYVVADMPGRLDAPLEAP
jgi:carboxypeptidase Q